MINFALLGCGRIAKRHADLLRTGQIPGARLAAVCDDYRHQIRGCESLGDLRALPGVDFVSVPTVSGMHADHAGRNLRASKHGMGARPMALTLVQDADCTIKAADATSGNSSPDRPS